jgi:hypothetical protein
MQHPAIYHEANNPRQSVYQPVLFLEGFIELNDIDLQLDGLNDDSFFSHQKSSVASK